MNGEVSVPVTRWLREAGVGDDQALGQVFEALYPELRRIAHARLHQQGGLPGQSTTVLVHESYLKLAGRSLPELENRRHFLAYAAKVMRNLIVDEVREHQALRRGGDSDHQPLDTLASESLAAPDADDSVMQVHEALQALQAIDADLARVVEMRWFAGYTEAEIAEIDGVSERTVRRRWEQARAWLEVTLGGAS